MKHYFLKLHDGLLWGMGFAIGCILVMHIGEMLYIYTGQQNQRVEKSPPIMELQKIKVVVENVAVFEERIIILTSVTNSNSVGIDQVEILVTVFSENQPFDHCKSDHLKFSGGESRAVSIFCRGYWEDLSEEKLTASAVIGDARAMDDGE